MAVSFPSGAERTNRIPVRVGIVGAGDIVRAVHLPVLKALPEVQVEWLCDIEPERARAMSKAYGTRAVELPRDPADLPAADVVLLATPYGVRRPYYEALRDRAPRSTRRSLLRARPGRIGKSAPGFPTMPWPRG